MKEIIVNGKTYHVEEMSVRETLSFHVEVMTTFGSSIGTVFSLAIHSSKGDEYDIADSMSAAFGKIEPTKCDKIIDKILSRTITPTNEYLRDPRVLQEWFSANPQDLWIVITKALIALVGEYFPTSILKDVESIKVKTSSETLK